MQQWGRVGVCGGMFAGVARSAAARPASLSARALPAYSPLKHIRRGLIAVRARPAAAFGQGGRRGATAQRPLMWMPQRAAPAPRRFAAQPPHAARRQIVARGASTHAASSPPLGEPPRAVEAFLRMLMPRPEQKARGVVVSFVAIVWGEIVEKLVSVLLAGCALGAGVVSFFFMPTTSGLPAVAHVNHRAGANEFYRHYETLWNSRADRVRWARDVFPGLQVKAASGAFAGAMFAASDFVCVLAAASAFTRMSGRHGVVYLLFSTIARFLFDGWTVSMRVTSNGDKVEVAVRQQTRGSQRKGEGDDGDRR